MSVHFLNAHDRCDRCDRCGKLAAVRAMSLLTDHTLCLSCLASEVRVMEALRAVADELARLDATDRVATRGTGNPARPDNGRPMLRMPTIVAGLADDPPDAPITSGEVRAAVRRLRERSALVRIPPGGAAPQRDLPPMS